LTAILKAGGDTEEWDRLDMADRRVVVDVDSGEVWLSVTGPVMLDALAAGVCRPLDTLAGPEQGGGRAMAPVSWLAVMMPDVTGELAVVRDGALWAARQAVGVRLH
jgi:hypothetical protein